MSQGQPSVIIWTNLVVLPYTMLHTKFQGHWSIGSGEDLLRFLPYMGMAAMLVMWPRPFEQFFLPGGCIWNLVAICPVVSEKKSFEIVDGRTTQPDYTISSPGAFGSGELKSSCIFLDHPKSRCKISKGSALNCRRSCLDKVHVPTTNPEPGITYHAPRKAENNVPPLFFEKAGDNYRTWNTLSAMLLYQWHHHSNYDIILISKWRHTDAILSRY